MSVIPNPANCAACGGGGSTPSPDFEHNSVVLCDTLADGTVVAAVILVQEYDELTGLPVGAPVPTNPATGAPYVVTGTLQACSSETCNHIALGTICYQDAPTPAHGVLDVFTNATLAGNVWTIPNFGGSGLPVHVTVTPIASGNTKTGSQQSIVLNGPGPVHVHVDFGSAVQTPFVSWGDFGNFDRIDNISPAANSVNGNGTLALGNTQVNPITGTDQNMGIQYLGNHQTVDFDYVAAGVGRHSTFGLMGYTVPAIPGTTHSATVLQDCSTGAVTYVNTQTGLPVVLANVTVVDCTTADSTPVTNQVFQHEFVLCDVTPAPAQTVTQALLRTASGVSNGWVETGTGNQAPNRPLPDAIFSDGGAYSPHNTATGSWVIEKTFNSAAAGVGSLSFQAFADDGVFAFTLNGNPVAFAGIPGTVAAQTLPATFLAGSNVIQITVTNAAVGPTYLSATLDAATPLAPATNSTRFIRKLIQDVAGTVTAVVDLDLAGAPYAIQGTVADCSQSENANGSVAEFVLCDTFPKPGPLASAVILDTNDVADAANWIQLAATQDGAPQAPNRALPAPIFAAGGVYGPNNGTAFGNWAIQKTVTSAVAGLGSLTIPAPGGSADDQITSIRVNGSPVPFVGIPGSVNGPQTVAASFVAGPNTVTIEVANTVTGNTYLNFSASQLSANTPTASTGPATVQFIRKIIQDPNGAVVSVIDLTLDGQPYSLVGTASLCPDAPVFAGFVCDAFGGSAQVPAVAPSCPGGAFGAAPGFQAGTGMTQGPAGTWTQTSNTGASLIWNRSPNDDQHAICGIKFVNDPSTGDNAIWQLFGGGTDINGNVFTLDAVWITAIETALGVPDLTDIPPGSTATATVGGTAVTITFDGPSTHSQMFASNGAFFVREQDGDGLAAGITLSFSPPIDSFNLGLNNTAGDPGTISGIQEAQAAPGTAAIPAQPASNTTVKQFRNSDGTSFYENLDGSAHSPLGTIGDCGEFFQEVLCDATGVTFLRLYHLTNGSVAGVQDYDLAGAVFAPVAPVGRCGDASGVYRHTPSEVLCYTAADTTVTQFLRRYLVSQDGVNVVATIDTLLDGATPFVAVVGGTVGVCSANDTGCTTASSIGTICYTPPFSAASPAVFMTDDWTGSAVVGANGGPQTITNSNFAGLGRVVTMSLSKGAGLTGNSVLLGVAPTVANALYSQHLDLGGSVTGLSITFNSFGTLGNEILRNFSVPFDTIVGAGSAVAGNTGVNPTASNGTVTLTWNGPLSGLDFEWRSQAGGTLSTVSTVSFTTVAVAGSDQTIGTAAVLVDCVTGAVTYRDLATGTVFDPATVTISDCGSSIVASSQGRVVADADAAWTPGTDVVGTLTSVTFTVLSGTATVIDSNGTILAGLPAGYTGTWAVQDSNALTGPQSIDAIGGNTVVLWTQK